MGRGAWRAKHIREWLEPSCTLRTMVEGGGRERKG